MHGSFSAHTFTTIRLSVYHFLYIGTDNSCNTSRFDPGINVTPPGQVAMVKPFIMITYLSKDLEDNMANLSYRFTEIMTSQTLSIDSVSFPPYNFFTFSPITSVVLSSI